LLKEYLPFKRTEQTNENFFLFLGEVYYLLGEISLEASFSELILYQENYNLGLETKEYFLTAIKYLNKGVALAGEHNSNSGHLLILAKAIFYSHYKSYVSIYRILKEINEDYLEEVEDIRFYALVNIFNDKVDSGLRLLEKKGEVKTDLVGQLFMSMALKEALYYNEAIKLYKKLLDLADTDKDLKVIYFNLGKIYYEQALYEEARVVFKEALIIDPGDQKIKNWLAKCHLKK